MKTVKLGQEVKRVSNKEADELIKQGWSFCAKLLWKQKNKKAPAKEEKQEEKKEEKPESKNTNSKKRRHNNPSDMLA